MGRKSVFSKEIKQDVTKRYEQGESVSNLSNEYGISAEIIYRWYNKYKAIGENVFTPVEKHRSYSKELKEEAINDYLKATGSLEDISNKYKISSPEILRKWIMKYNSHIEITDYNPKPEVYMAKSRKTIYEERLEIVKYCLEHEKNYKETAIQFGVNYSQVYSWVKKYKEDGEEALLDKRGRKKLESEMNEEEKLKHKLKKSEAKNAYLEMENKALKKLEEIERRMIRGKSKKQSTKRF